LQASIVALPPVKLAKDRRGAARVRRTREIELTSAAEEDFDDEEREWNRVGSLMSKLRASAE
jgi:hypothetical protein